MQRKLAYGIALVLVITASSFTPVKKQPGQTSARSLPVVVSNWMIDLDQTFYIGGENNGEWVRFTGKIHLQTKYFPNDPLKVHSNLVSVQGTGLTSGLNYYLSGSDQTEQSVLPGSEFSTDHSYNFLPPNPILPPSPIRFRYTMNINSLGQLINVNAEIIPGLIIEG